MVVAVGEAVEEVDLAELCTDGGGGVWHGGKLPTPR
jgi:hypothetical protein